MSLDPHPPSPSNSVDPPEFSLSIAHSIPEGIPVFRAMGALADSGWQRLIAACSLEPRKLRILDFTGVTHCETQTSDAASFARRLSRESAAGTEPSYHVFIAPGDLLFGICRVIQSHLDMAGQRAAVVRSMAAARLWLKSEGLTD